MFDLISQAIANCIRRGGANCKFMAFVACWSIAFLVMLAIGHGAEPAAKIVYVGAKWCGPCAGAKKFTIPELKKAGANVDELDFDRDGDKLPASVTDLPTWFVIGADGQILDTIVGHVHQDVILKRMASVATLAKSVGPPVKNHALTSVATPDLVAQLRRFLGTTKPRSHSSLGWQFEEPLDIPLDAKTRITRPKQLFAEFDFRDDTLTVTFAEPLPQAHVIKAGATLSVDIPRVTIKGNVVTATADVAFGIKKDFQFTITQSPFDE